jgi:hypothetical protein
MSGPDCATYVKVGRPSRKSAKALPLNWPALKTNWPKSFAPPKLSRSK